jgi:hypothetical protein
MLGFQIRGKIPLKTKVIVAYGNGSYIVGNVNKVANYSTPGRTATQQETKAKDSEQAPVDMIPGEFEISNSFGMAMQFLTTLMKMSASDRAVVEVHALNDMVRIISGQFRHVSPLGEELMFDHGRPTMERSWTSYRHELFGKSKTTEPLADANGDEMKTTIEERMTAVGKHRLLEYFGFAGDFIHSFITDPSATALSLSENANDSAGKSWMHRNSDGSVIIQSVADIAIERVCRIPVPLRISPHESRETALERNYEKLNGEYLREFNNGSDKPKDAYRSAYQLRVYARWLSRYHALARMAQLDKDYRVPTESEAATPSWGCGEQDKELRAAEYVDAYACFRIMRDGSIVILDGYGSSWSMSNGDVQVSAARHFECEAAGDIRMTAGGNFLVKAKRHAEITASEGGLILYGLAFVKMLADRGSLFLRSNADTESSSEPTPVNEGGPVPEIATNGEEKHAVVIEAPRGRTLTRSGFRQTHAIDGIGSAGTKDFIVNTTGDIATRCRDMTLYVSRDLLQSVGRNVVMTAALVLGRVADWFVAGVRVKNGKFYAQSIATRSLESNQILSDEVGPTQPPNERNAVPVHFNHVLRRSSTGDVPLPDDIAPEAAALLAASKGPPLVSWKSINEGHRWSFLSSADYYWDTRSEQPGTYVETVAQQRIRLEVTGSDRWQGPGYETWTLQQADSAPRMGVRSSWGCDVWHFRSDAGDSLHSTVSTEIINLPTQADWQLVKRTFKVLKIS